MISHIHSTTVFVSDQDSALEFYVSKLGWEKRADTPFGEGARWLAVAPAGATTELVLAQPSRSARGDDQPGDSDCDISLVTADLDATVKELTERGVTFKNEPEEMPWGARATWFSDPDGNTFFLTEHQLD